MHPIKRLRGERRLTLRHLEERSGVAKETISEIERGVRKPRIITLTKLAEALEVPVEVLVEETTYPKAPAPLSLEDLADFLKQRVGSAWLASPEEEWHNWWRGVSKEEASRRYQQIVDEGALITKEWLATREGRSTLAPRGYAQWGNLYSFTFARKFPALFFAPQEAESEEEFQKRSTEGRAIDAYYQSPFVRQRRDVEEEVKETERALVGAATS